VSETNDIITPIQSAIVAALVKANLFKVVTQDVVIDNLAENIDTLINAFPAAIVNYLGGVGARTGGGGTMLEITQTYGIAIAARSVAGPNKSDRIAKALLGPVMDALLGRKLASLQQDGLMWSGEDLVYKDKVWTLYQQKFETKVIVNFRGALASS
jgi:hypothetical protein